MNYAIVENGVVTNIISLNPENAHEFQGAVLVGEVSAGIGDAYADDAFWRDGVRMLTPLEAAQATIAALDTALVDAIYENSLLALGLE